MIGERKQNQVQKYLKLLRRKRKIAVIKDALQEKGILVLSDSEDYECFLADPDSASNRCLTRTRMYHA